LAAMAVVVVVLVALCLLLDSSVCTSLAGMGGCVANGGALWCVSAPRSPSFTPVARGCRGVVSLHVAF
jgi:hypothetical protein